MSLRLRLGVFFSLFLIAAWLVAAFFAWKEAREYIDEFFDTQQMLFAKRLATANLSNYRGTLPESRELFPGIRKKHLGELDDDALGVAVFTRAGALVMADDRKGRRFSFEPDKRGFSETRLSGKKDIWRILWLDSMDGSHVIAVGQEVEYRQDMALDMLGEQIMPWLLLLPALLVGLLVLLSRELAPLQEMAERLRTRSPNDGTMLDTAKIPSEVRPMADALNEYIARINDLIMRERSFISNAAHELRTPLAGLRVQAQVASQEGIDPEVREASLMLMRQGIDRCGRLLEQLLALSRLEASKETAAGNEPASRTAFTPVGWDKLLEEILGEFKAKTQEKNISVNCANDATVTALSGNAELLGMMLRNLLDNAVRYSPVDGTIQVRLEDAALRIENSCLPISEAYRTRIGERFFRPPGQNEDGSGLGLSIVKRIADMHGFRLHIEIEDQGAGNEWAIFRVVIG